LKNPALLRFLVIAAFVIAIIATVAALSPGAVSGEDAAYAAPLSIWLVWMVLRLATATRHPMSKMAKQLSVFLILGVVLVVGYSYRDDFNGIFGRALGTAVPGHGTEVAPGMMRVQADDGGQFVINATVNGTAIHFLVDTGASGIALSQRDARRLGIDPKDLGYTAIFSTANGKTRAAPIKLDSIQVGPLSASNVSAWVNEGDLDQSLLGMSYLSTLGRIEIRGDTLILER
jgi:aspartyl protease family protein